MARAEVARLTGLSPATVTGITADLIDEGLVFEKEPGDFERGAAAHFAGAQPGGGYVVGIKLMETRWWGR